MGRRFLTSSASMQSLQFRKVSCIRFKTVYLDLLLLARCSKFDVCAGSAACLEICSVCTVTGGISRPGHFDGH